MVIRDIEKHTPAIGDFVKPDQWHIGSCITEGDNPVDNDYHGSQFRIDTNNGYIPSLPVNITVTGHPQYDQYYKKHKSRIKIEFVHDGEPNTFSGGFIYHKI